MSDYPNQPSNGEIIEAALDYAVQFGVKASTSNCRVEAVSNNQIIPESGGPTFIRLPISKWYVYVTPASSPHVLVVVEFMTGGICATKLTELPRRNGKI